MHCPICGTPLRPSPFTRHFRRGARWVEVAGDEMRCPEAHGGDEGELYFAIMTEEQGERFHAATDLAWMTRYGEPMPAARRPGRKPAPAAVVILRFSAEEIADVDARRGALSRADFLKRRATG